MPKNRGENRLCPDCAQTVPMGFLEVARSPENGPNLSVSSTSKLKLYLETGVTLIDNSG